MAFRTPEVGHTKAESAQDIALRVAADFERATFEYTAEYFADNVPFSQLTVPDPHPSGPVHQLTWSPQVHKAVHTIGHDHLIAMDRVARQLEQTGSHSGKAWKQELKEQIMLRGVAASVKRRSDAGGLDRQFIEAVEVLPAEPDGVGRLRDIWLECTIADIRDRKPTGVIERDSVTFSYLCVKTPAVNPERRDERRLKSDQNPVRTMHFKRLVDTHGAIRTGQEVVINIGGEPHTVSREEINTIARLGYRDVDLDSRVILPPSSYTEVLQPTAPSERSYKKPLLTAAGLSIIAGVAVPTTAAAEAPSVAPSTAPNHVNVVGSPNAVAHPTIVVTSTPRAAQAAHTLSVKPGATPLYTSESQVTSVAQSPAQETVSQELSVAPATSGATTLVGTTPENLIVPTQEPQLEDGAALETYLDLKAKGKLTPAVAVQAAVALGAPDAALPVEAVAPQTDTAESKEGKAVQVESIESLTKTNPLLAAYLDGELEDAKQVFSYRDVTTLTGREEVQSTLTHLRTFMTNSSYFDLMTKAEREALLHGGDKVAERILNEKAKEISSELGKVENGEYENMSKETQALVNMLLAKIDLAKAPQDDVDARITAVNAAIEQEAAEAAAKKAAEEKEARERALAERAASGKLSSKDIKIKALKRMASSKDTYISRGAEVALKLISLPEDLRGKITIPIAFGAVANVRDETGTANLDFSTEQVGGPAAGGFQWEGGRKEQLFDFADRQGKPWTSETVQLQNFIRELEGPESYAWEQIRHADTEEEAATLILKYFERAADSQPGGENDQDRRGYASVLGKALDKEIGKIKREIREAQERARNSEEGQRAEIVKILKGEVGVKETPHGCDAGNPSSHGTCGPRIDQYTQMTREYWCADFATWVDKKAGIPFTGSKENWRLPAVRQIKNLGHERDTWHSRSSGYTPKPGDYIIFGSGDSTEHVARVVKADSTHVSYIGGNQRGAGSSNGNAVTYVTSGRDYGWILGYVEPNFD